MLVVMMLMMMMCDVCARLIIIIITTKRYLCTLYQYHTVIKNKDAKVALEQFSSMMRFPQNFMSFF